MLKNINLKYFSLDRLRFEQEDKQRFEKIKAYLLSKDDFFSLDLLGVRYNTMLLVSLKSINIKHCISNFIGLFSTLLFITLSFGTENIQLLLVLFILVLFHNYIGIKNIITDYVHTLWSREILYNLFVLLSVYSIYSFLSL